MLVSFRQKITFKKKVYSNQTANIRQVKATPSMFFQLLITWTILHTVTSQCVYNYNSSTRSIVSTCENLTIENYVYHMDKLNPQIQKDVGKPNTLDITINFKNSVFSELNSWITLPMTSVYPFWAVSSIYFNFSSCGIQSISPNTFDFSGISNLYALDLSFNNITNVDFLMNTPKLEYLYLKNATDSFSIFKNLLIRSPCNNPLKYIDLSYTNIEIVELKSFACFPIFDLGYSTVKQISGPSSTNKLTMNLTNCEHLQVMNGSISGTRITFMDLDMSYINNFDISILAHTRVLYSLNLTNTNIVTLDKDSFDLFTVVEGYSTTIDLSHTNLKSMSKLYFSKRTVAALNLSSNNLSVLDEEVFSNANIKQIDLSNSQIFVIKRGCFENLTADTLLLSHNNIADIEISFTGAKVKELSLSNNNISSINDIFSNTTITTLDLSFNPIGSIDSSTFATCLNLKALNLSNTYIPNIADYTFKSLSTLQYLEISISGNFNPETFESLYLKSLNISNSNIPTLQDGNFKGLYSLENLSFNNTIIENVAKDAIKYIVNVKTLDTNILLKNLKVIPKGFFEDILSLTYLDLSYLQFEGFEAGAFDGLINLKAINVTGSNLENDFSMISNFVKLN